MNSQPIGICLVGAGRAGMIHANNFQNKADGAYIAAVADASEDAARSAAERLGADHYCTDYRDALKNPDVNAVVVVAPTDLHKEIVITCARAKKHIFCEKPMAMNAPECEEMIRAVKDAGVKLQIGFMRRFDKSFQKAKEDAESGAIGDIVMVRSHTRGPSKPRPWMYDIKKSNGVLAELCSHDIDTIRWFADSEIKNLYAVAGNYRNREIVAEYPDYYDNVVMNGEFENGVQFSIDGAAYIRYGYDCAAEILGTKGVIHIGRQNAYNYTLTTAESGITTPHVSGWAELFSDAYLAEDIAFIKSIAEDTPPEVTGEDGLAAVKTVEAGNRSIAQKRALTL